MPRLCALVLALAGTIVAAEDNLAALSERAREAMMAERFEDAATLYRQMLKSLPGESGLRLNLAVALDGAGRNREAAEQLELIRKAQAGNPRFWFLLGIEYQKLQQPAKAVAPLDRAVALDPANAAYRLELADACLASGASARAQSLFEKLAQDQPGNPKALQGVVLASLALSQPDKAHRALERLAALPPSVEVHELLARVYRETGRREEATAELREALHLAPGDPRLRGELAEDLWSGRHYEEAAVILSDLVRANPDRPSWQLQLGDCLFNLGQPEQALVHLHKAVELAPQNLSAHAVLGRVMLETGNDDQAVTELLRAESIDRDGSLHFQLATAYRHLGKPELAVKALARQKQIQEASKRH